MKGLCGRRVIVYLIIKEGSFTKLAVLKYLTVEDLLRWKTPFAMARYLIEEAVPTMLRDLKSLNKETTVTHVLMNQEHEHAFVVNNSHVAHAHAKATVNLEHLRSHVESSNSTVTPDVNSSVSPTLTRGNGADLREEPSAKRRNDFLQKPSMVPPQGLPVSHRYGKSIVFHYLRFVRTAQQRTKLPLHAV
jgi:hypothetical protein